MKVPVPTVFQRMVARFWMAVLVICFLPTMVVLVMAVLDRVFPYVLVAAIVLMLGRWLVRLRRGW